MTAGELKRAAVVIGGLAYLAWSLIVLVAGVGDAAVNCGEACLQPGESSDWTYYADAWQWPAIGALAVVQLLASIATLVLAKRGLRVRAFLAFLTALAAVVALGAIRLTGGGFDLNTAWVTSLVLGEAGGLASQVGREARPRRLS